MCCVKDCYCILYFFAFNWYNLQVFKKKSTSCTLEALEKPFTFCNNNLPARITAWKAAEHKLNILVEWANSNNTHRHRSRSGWSGFCWTTFSAMYWKVLVNCRQNVTNKLFIIHVFYTPYILALATSWQLSAKCNLTSRTLCRGCGLRLR